MSEMTRTMKLTRARLWTIRSLAGELVRKGYRSDGDIYEMICRLQEMVTTTRSRSWESALDFIELDSRGRGRMLLRRSMTDLELKIRRMK